MNGYLWHLKKQTIHQLRAPLGLPDSIVNAARAIAETTIRILAPTILLPLAPLFACVTLWDERKTRERLEEAQRRLIEERNAARIRVRRPDTKSDPRNT